MSANTSPPKAVDPNRADKKIWLVKVDDVLYLDAVLLSDVLTQNWLHAKVMVCSVGILQHKNKISKC